MDISSLQNSIGLNPEIKTIGSLISIILPYIFIGAGLALLVFLIIGGFQFLTSAGDPKSMEAGKARITQALIGFIIIFVSYWLVQIIAKILGIEAIQTIFK
jgi:hypothetical protein